MSLFNEDNIFSKYTYLTYGPLKGTKNISHNHKLNVSGYTFLFWLLLKNETECFSPFDMYKE